MRVTQPYVKGSYRIVIELVQSRMTAYLLKQLPCLRKADIYHQSVLFSFCYNTQKTLYQLTWEILLDMQFRNFHRTHHSKRKRRIIKFLYHTLFEFIKSILKTFLLLRFTCYWFAFSLLFNSFLSC